MPSNSKNNLDGFLSIKTPANLAKLFLTLKQLTIIFKLDCFRLSEKMFTNMKRSKLQKVHLSLIDLALTGVVQ